MLLRERKGLYSRRLAGALAGLFSFTSYLYFLRSLISHSGVVGSDQILTGLAFWSLISFPMATVALAIQREILKNSDAKLNLTNFALILMVYLTMVALASTKWHIDPITAALPILLGLINAQHLLLDAFDRQWIKLLGATAPLTLFAFTPIMHPVIIYSLYLGIRVLFYFFFVPCTLKLPKRVAPLDQLAFALVQNCSEQGTKLILTYIAPVGSVVLYDAFNRTFYSLRGFLGAVIQPDYFALFRSSNRGQVRFFHTYNMLSLFVYLGFASLLIWIYRDLSFSAESVLILSLAFWLNQLGAIRYGKFLISKGFYFLSLLTLIIPIVTAITAFLVGDIILSFAVAIFCTTAALYVFRLPQDEKIATIRGD
jgi:hypothetical protein